jgi:hypothetical protein
MLEMWVQAAVRKHINCLPEEAIFCTREFLSYGKRYAVDQALSRMVRRKEILRVAWGVFVKNVPGLPQPSNKEIIEAKLGAFARDQKPTARAHAAEFKLPCRKSSRTELDTDGGTSSFRILETIQISQRQYKIRALDRVRVHSRVARKMILGSCTYGKAISALWAMGEYGCKIDMVSDVRHSLGRNDREKFDLAMRWMPWWLSDMVHDTKRYQYANMAGKTFLTKKTKRLAA